MARYFAFNTLAAMDSRTSAASVVETTATAAAYDSAYVSNTIGITGGSNSFDITGPFQNAGTSITGTFYLRFDLYLTVRFNTNSGLLILNGGANAYRIILGTGVNTLQFQYWNSGTSAWVNWGSQWSESGVNRVTYTLQLNPGTSFTFYRNGAVISSGTSPTNAAATVDTFRFGQFDDLGVTHYSQVMCASYDLRDSHIFSRLPAANGNYTAGTGTAADVAEAVLDDGTAVNLAAVADKRTFTKATITLPSGLKITAMGVNARSRVGGGTVTGAKIKCRSGTTDSNVTVTPAAAYSCRRAEFATDPNTAAAWGATGFNSAEFGLEAA